MLVYSARVVSPPFNPADWSSTDIHGATEVLIQARALVVRGWCRGTLARNWFGRSVSPYPRRAVKWCASGALKAAAMTCSSQDHWLATCRLNGVIPDDDIVDFNDRQKTVEPVLAAFDQAIALGDDSKVIAAGGK
jgi:hypothetical protein